MHERPIHGQRYSIRVGFRKMEVSGRSRAEAIQRAREQLCQDMPRMWDVIQALEVHKFEIHELDP
jgi:hypothetical protein